MEPPDPSELLERHATWEGLNLPGTFLVGMVSELANGLRLGFVVSSQHLSGAWITVGR
jgi:hypothetical protein